MRKKFFASLLLSLICVFQGLDAMSKEEFKGWWSGYRSSPQIQPELQMMVDHYVDSGLLDVSSNYWNYLNKKNIEQIAAQGFQNFKQTVAQNYFTWVVNANHPYASNLKNQQGGLPITISPQELNRKHDFLSLEESRQFNYITYLYLNYIYKNGGAAYLNYLEEPSIGNPPCIYFQGRRISQDVLNSLQEYLSMERVFKMDNLRTVLEIGAGSGRTAYCFLKIHPTLKYVIADIPPALYISQTYLSEVFPEKKIFKFRPFKSFDEVMDEYAAADIVFITPDQLPNIPDKSIDIFLAIDCLHEMTPDRINYYISQAGRLGSFMYYKCWQKTLVPFDGIAYSTESYGVPPSWKLLFKEPCVVPSDFFHAFYEIK